MDFLKTLDWQRLSDQFKAQGFNLTPDQLKEIFEISAENATNPVIKDDFSRVASIAKHYNDTFVKVQSEVWDADPEISVADLPPSFKVRFETADKALKKNWPPFYNKYELLKDQLFREYRKKIKENEEKIRALQLQLDTCNKATDELKNKIAQLEKEKVELETKLKAASTTPAPAKTETKTEEKVVVAPDLEIEKLKKELEEVKVKKEELELEVKKLTEENVELVEENNKLRVSKGSLFGFLRRSRPAPKVVIPPKKEEKHDKGGGHGGGHGDGHDDHGHDDHGGGSSKWKIAAVALLWLLTILVAYAYGRSKGLYGVNEQALKAEIAAKAERITDLEKANSTLRGDQVMFDNVQFTDGSKSRARLWCPEDKPAFQAFAPDTAGEPGYGRNVYTFGCGKEQQAAK